MTSRKHPIAKQMTYGMTETQRPGSDLEAVVRHPRLLVSLM
ncbi:hypothetical protein I545_2604 [Mycobacterium kansasii 662]|uniref:Uncharacterized protein n=2 Tax=Mycobacterium kansasii TaxID=1768 RepID=A0A1V3WN76_MYCKA|nr:hypothetical protein I547_4533 [Mycobacterium kansasii 824]EUA19027.1 hypothetical protein I545_2604 [Mycobacterium kansasii 662]KEP40513.1 hypothetical protein MKSMC1_43400 [Mycobacterium kansasii]OOK68413.1 hypothetical protein BZL29_7030 [Mycobacterium kansasii]OOK71902.1 hypothetical protein BZL30_5414 [Mycobacterium kansasii]